MLPRRRPHRYRASLAPKSSIGFQPVESDHCEAQRLSISGKLGGVWDESIDAATAFDTGWKPMLHLVAPSGPTAQPTTG